MQKFIDGHFEFRFRRRRNARRAFTLTEAVMAIVILSIAVVPMMLAVEASSKDQVTPIMVSRARWLATEKLEEIIADRNSRTRGYDFVVSGNYPAEAPVISDPDFARTVSITETGADLQTAGSGYKTVTVTVSWTDVKQQNRTLTVSTVVTDFS